MQVEAEQWASRFATNRLALEQSQGKVSGTEMHVATTDVAYKNDCDWVGQAQDVQRQ